MVDNLKKVCISTANWSNSESNTFRSARKNFLHNLIYLLTFFQKPCSWRIHSFQDEISTMSIALNLKKEVLIRRNNSKVDSIETGCIVIAHLLPWNDLEKCIYGRFFQLMMIKFHRHYFIYKCNFACLLFWATCKLTNNRKIILISNFWLFQRLSFQLFSLAKLKDC